MFLCSLRTNDLGRKGSFTRLSRVPTWGAKLDKGEPLKTFAFVYFLSRKTCIWVGYYALRVARRYNISEFFCYIGVTVKPPPP